MKIESLVEIQDSTVGYLTDLILNAIKTTKLQENSQIVAKMIVRSEGLSKASEIMETTWLKNYANSKMVKVMEYRPIFENKFESLGSMVLKGPKKKKMYLFLYKGHTVALILSSQSRRILSFHQEIDT